MNISEHRNIREPGYVEQPMFLSNHRTVIGISGANIRKNQIEFSQKKSR